MSSRPQTEPPPELREAMAVLAGDPAAARDKAQAALSSPAPDPRFWVVAGQASRMLDDWQGIESAADGLLAAAPAAILGLIWKGDCFSKRGEPRNAAGYYSAALRAAKDAGPLPEATQLDLQRVARELEEIGRIYAWHLDEHLRSRSITEQNMSPAFAQTFAILTGQHQPTIERQRPSVLYFPGLPQRAYYERDEFDWVQRVEVATDDIRAELEPVLADPANFRPYVTGEQAGPARDYHGMQNNEEWTSFYLWAEGEPVAENIARCPKTAALLETLPRPHFPNRCPTAMFSRLTPGAHIPPHNGMLNVRLICHLPLVVPDGCGFKVGGERRDWEQGKLVIFDDSIEHEAWNHGDADRVVLLFDIARPEIDDGDQKALAALFEAVDSFR